MWNTSSWFSSSLFLCQTTASESCHYNAPLAVPYLIIPVFGGQTASSSMTAFTHSTDLCLLRLHPPHLGSNTFLPALGWLGTIANTSCFYPRWKFPWFGGQTWLLCHIKLPPKSSCTMKALAPGWEMLTSIFSSWVSTSCCCPGSED